MTRGALLLCMLLAGCSRDVIRLEPEWAPLVEVVERPSLVFTDETSTTLGTRLYVADLDGWERRYPEGSVQRTALLLHEQEHARRQLAAGLGRWLGRYLNDTDFMWAEEQRGWALELRHLARNGRPVTPEAVAAALHDYQNLAGRMIGFAEALAFVRAVLAGTFELSLREAVEGDGDRVALIDWSWRASLGCHTSPLNLKVESFRGRIPQQFGDKLRSEVDDRLPRGLELDMGQGLPADVLAREIGHESRTFRVRALRILDGRALLRFPEAPRG